MLKTRPTSRRTRPGFTLMEAAYSTILVGLSVAAIAAMMGSGTRANSGAQNLSTAVFLAQELRELTAELAFEGGPAFGPDTGETHPALYDDLDDFRAYTFGPNNPDARYDQPVSAQRDPVSRVPLPLDGTGGRPDLRGWTQRITVHSVDPQYLAYPSQADVDAYYFGFGPAPFPPNGSTDALRVNVDILPPRSTQPIYSLSWVVHRP